MLNDSLKFLLGFVCGILLYFLIYNGWKNSEVKRVSFIGDIFIRLAEKMEQTEDTEMRQKKAEQIINLDKDVQYKSDNFSVANQLRHSVKILCVVIVDYRQAYRRLKVLNDTWIARCSDVILFTSRARSEVLKFKHHILSTSDAQNRELHRKRLYEILTKTYESGAANFDWIILATDDTYVIMENLRYFLSELNSSLPLFVGRIDPSEYIVHRNLRSVHKLSHSVVFSKAALTILVTSYLNQSQECNHKGVYGDIYRDLCMEERGINSLNGTDKYGLERFNIIIPELWGVHISYSDIQSKEPITLSDFAVSFRYITPPGMYGLELMAYHLRPFGIIHPHEEIN